VDITVYEAQPIELPDPTRPECWVLIWVNPAVRGVCADSYDSREAAAQTARELTCDRRHSFAIIHVPASP
jgi:hypothetical protein